MLKGIRNLFLISVVIVFFVWMKNGSSKGVFNVKNSSIEWLRNNKSILNKLTKGSINKSGDYFFNNTDTRGYKLESLTNGIPKDVAVKNVKQFGGTEESIITLINKERFDAGLNSLDKSKRLMKSSLAKAEDMKKNHYFEHVSVQKIQPWFFAERIGYQYEKFGENIALDYLSANSVHKAFMDSVGHKANILDENFKDVGVAIFPIESNEGLKYVVVEHFGEPLNNINPEKKEKYSNKSKRFCAIQESKKKELKKMIKNQKKIIEEFKIEINKQAIEDGEQRLKELENIKESVKKYLDNCAILKEKYEDDK